MMKVIGVIPAISLIAVASISGCLGGDSERLEGEDVDHKEEIVSEDFSDETWAAQYVGCNSVINMCVSRSFPPAVIFYYQNMTMLELDGTVEWGEDASSIAGRTAHIRCQGEPEDCGNLAEPVVVEGTTSPMEISLDLNVSAGTKVEVMFVAEQVEAGPLWTSYEIDERVSFSGIIKLKKDSTEE